MKFIIGEKQDMTQLFSKEGKLVAATRVKVAPCVVTQVKTVSRDGYESVQIGAGRKKKANSPLRGHLSALIGFFENKAPKYIKEFRLASGSFKVGDIISADLFEEGEKVFVRGVSKGRGFAGVVKRHGFKGSPASHGHKDQLRMPGSIGVVEGRVRKGKKMGGRMGCDSIMVRNLEILKIDNENGYFYIKGALPGARNGCIEIFSHDFDFTKKVNHFDKPAKQDTKDMNDSEQEKVVPKTTDEEKTVVSKEADNNKEEDNLDKDVQVGEKDISEKITDKEQSDGAKKDNK